jgi:hypothetical protein
MYLQTPGSGHLRKHLQEQLCTQSLLPFTLHLAAQHKSKHLANCNPTHPGLLSKPMANPSPTPHHRVGLARVDPRHLLLLYRGCAVCRLAQLRRVRITLGRALLLRQRGVDHRKLALQPLHLQQGRQAGEEGKCQLAK